MTFWTLGDDMVTTAFFYWNLNFRQNGSLFIKKNIHRKLTTGFWEIFLLSFDRPTLGLSNALTIIWIRHVFQQIYSVLVGMLKSHISYQNHCFWSKFSSNWNEWRIVFLKFTRNHASVSNKFLFCGYLTCYFILEKIFIVKTTVLVVIFNCFQNSIQISYFY